MAEFAALPLFTDSWKADTDHLERAERGLYLDFLVLLWRSPECRVPNEIEWISRRLRCSDDELPMLRKIIAEFMSSTGNWLFQKRLTKEFRYTRDKRQKQSDRAKSRWNKDKPDTPAEPPQSQGNATSRNAPSPSPSPSPSAQQGAALDWGDLETKLRQAAGWQSEPHPNLHVVGQIAALIDSGADLERDVLPIVKAKAPLVRKRTSWNFFVDPIKEARDKRLAISVPQPQSAQAPIWENWTDRQYEAAITAVKRSGRWPETFGPVDRIPEHLLDDELRRIIGRRT